MIAGPVSFGGAVSDGRTMPVATTRCLVWPQIGDGAGCPGARRMWRPGRTSCRAASRADCAGRGTEQEKTTDALGRMTGHGPDVCIEAVGARPSASRCP